MRRITLQRVTGLSPTRPTYGVLVDEGVAFALTLEPAWLNNGAKSCIPEGVYRCVRDVSPKFGETFEVTGVLGRSRILFHWGSFAADSLGCILVGERFTDLNADGVQDLSMSRTTAGAGFLEFLERLRGCNEFTFRVANGVA